MSGIKVTKTTVEKLTITSDHLDPIGVFIEEFNLGQAKMTIEVYGDSWSHYWSHMGEVSLREFFTDIPYLAMKFCRGDTDETDYELISKKIGEEVDITSLWCSSELMNKHFGDDWHMGLPTKHTREYNYLKKIIAVIIEAFKTEAV